MSETVTELTPRPRKPRAGRTRTVAAVVIAAVLAAVIGLFAGSRLGDRNTPSEISVDAGFARDMGVHLNQAVQMSALVSDRTDDPEVGSLAQDIMLTRQQQAGQMFAWLELWDLPQSSSTPEMAWMTVHSGHGAPELPAEPGSMPGMATQGQLGQLADASGRDAERLYLQLMIPHHEAGVAMAEFAADEADNDAVQHLAQTIVDAQNAELAVLRDLLSARGGPLPEA
ncbi:MAG: DUF305 domain-containing protein [Jiangellaceae bacterium]